MGGLTPFQTLGPFFDFGLVIRDGGIVCQSAATGRHVAIEGTVRDGAGDVLPDALIEDLAGECRRQVPPSRRCTGSSARSRVRRIRPRRNRRQRTIRLQNHRPGTRARAGRHAAGAASGDRGARARSAHATRHAGVFRGRTVERRRSDSGAGAGANDDTLCSPDGSARIATDSTSRCRAGETVFFDV